MLITEINDLSFNTSTMVKSENFFHFIKERSFMGWRIKKKNHFIAVVLWGMWKTWKEMVFPVFCLLF